MALGAGDGALKAASELYLVMAVAAERSEKGEVVAEEDVLGVGEVMDGSGASGAEATVTTVDAVGVMAYKGPELGVEVIEVGGVA